jgi:hypothetical protein
MKTKSRISTARGFGKAPKRKEQAQLELLHPVCVQGDLLDWQEGTFYGSDGEPTNTQISE